MISRHQAWGALLFILLQVGWFANVLGAARGLLWLGPLVVGLLVILHLVWADRWRSELELVIVLGLVGSTLDSLAAALGLISFRGQPAWWLCPAWITALWLHFGTVRDGLLRWIHGRWVLAAVLGAVGGPLAYAAGARLGAAALHPRHPEWTLAWLAVEWGLLLPLASWFTWRHDPPPGGSPS